MEKQFWEQKWEAQELGFHLSFVHPILKRNLAAFDLPAGATVFLPLCGKTLDICWSRACVWSGSSSASWR